MFTVTPISIRQARSFIREHQLNYFMNKGYEGTKYEFAYKGRKYKWFGVWNGDRMVAVQVTENPVFGSIHLVCLQKAPGVGKGVFRSIMNYFSNYTIYFEAYDKKLQKMYKGLGFEQISEFKFKK